MKTTRTKPTELEQAYYDKCEAEIAWLKAQIVHLEARQAEFRRKFAPAPVPVALTPDEEVIMLELKQKFLQQP